MPRKGAEGPVTRTGHATFLIAPVPVSVCLLGFAQISKKGPIYRSWPDLRYPSWLFIGMLGMLALCSVSLLQTLVHLSLSLFVCLSGATTNDKLFLISLITILGTRNPVLCHTFVHARTKHLQRERIWALEPCQRSLKRHEKLNCYSHPKTESDKTSCP